MVGQEHSIKMLVWEEPMGRENEEEGTKRTNVWSHVLPPPHRPHPQCLLDASTHDISQLGRNGIFQFQMSAKEKGLRLKFSLNGQPGRGKMKLHRD